MKEEGRGGRRNGVWLRRALDTRYVITPRSATPAAEQPRERREREREEVERGKRESEKERGEESLTDLHKGTHNCAAAIRESGAGISSPSLAPPTPAFLHPRSGSQPPQPTSPPTTPVGASKGLGEGRSTGTQSVRCYHFSTRVGGGVGGSWVVLPGFCSPLALSCPASLRPFFRAKVSSTWTLLFSRTIFLSDARFLRLLLSFFPNFFFNLSSRLCHAGSRDSVNRFLSYLFLYRRQV